MCKYTETANGIRAAIEGTLSDLCSRHIRQHGFDFACKDAILYLPDAESRYLEPAFFTSGLIDRPFSPILIAVGSPESGLVSYAFDSRHPKVSLKPHDDPRIGQTAKGLLPEYSFSNSLLALPILPVASRRIPSDWKTAQPCPVLGVLLIHTDKPLDSDPPLDAVFDQTVYELASLLHQYEADQQRSLGQHYSDLSSIFLRNIRPVAQAENVYRDFDDFCHSAFRTDVAFLSIESALPTRTDELLPYCSRAELAGDLGSLIEHAFADREESHEPFIVIDYTSQYPHLAHTLFRLVGEDHRAWITVQLPVRGAMVCRSILGRRITSTSSFWSSREASLLQHACSYFAILLDRAAAFRETLTTLRHPSYASGSETLSEGDFHSFAYICREFLNTDQFLVCRIIQNESQYVVKGEYAYGFDEIAEKALVHETQRTLSLADLPSLPPDVIAGWNEVVDAESDLDPNRPDILAFIVQLFCSQTPEACPVAFMVSHTKKYKHFKLDYDLATRCAVGDVAFVPCVAEEPDGTHILRAIVMLASSGGTEFTERVPLLRHFASELAASVSDLDRSASERKLADIRSVTNCTPDSLACIAEKGASSCRAITSSIWLRIDCAEIVTGTIIDRFELTSAIQRYLQILAKRPSGAGTSVAHELPPGAAMVASFFGVQNDALPQCCDGATRTLAELVGSSLYFPVASADSLARNRSAISGDRFREVISTVVSSYRNESDDDLFLKQTAKLFETTYLPGHGLTGWSLRYAKVPIRVAQLRSEDAKDVYDRVTVSSKQCQPSGVDRQLAEQLHGKICKSVFIDTQIPEPIIRQHVRDHNYTIRRPFDALMCEPFGQFDSDAYPSGIVRMTLASSFTGQFDDRDEQVLLAVTSHLADLLRAKLMEKSHIIQKYDNDEQLRHYLAHRLRRFRGDVETLRTWFASVKNGVPADVVDAITRLDITSRRVSWYGAYRKFLREVASIPGGDVTLGCLESYLTVWFREQSYGTPVVVERVGDVENGTPVLNNGEDLLLLCLLVDELVANSSFHSNLQPQKIAVALERSDTRRLVVAIHERGQIPSDGADSVVVADESCDIRWMTHDEYIRTSVGDQPSRQGRGAEYISRWSSQLGVAVFVGLGPDRRVYVVGDETSINQLYLSSAKSQRQVPSGAGK